MTSTLDFTLSSVFLKYGKDCETAEATRLDPSLVAAVQALPNELSMRIGELCIDAYDLDFAVSHDSDRPPRILVENHPLAKRTHLLASLTPSFREGIETALKDRYTGKLCINDGVVALRDESIKSRDFTWIVERTTDPRIELSKLMWPPYIDYSILCRARIVECVRIDEYSRALLREWYKILYELKSAETTAKRYGTLWIRRNLSTTHVKQMQALGLQLKITLRSIYPDAILAPSIDVLSSPPRLVSKKMTIQASDTGQYLRDCGEGAGWQIEPTEHDMFAQGNDT